MYKKGVGGCVQDSEKYGRLLESPQKAEFAQKTEFAQTMKRHNSEEKHLTIRFFSYFKHNNKALFDMTRDVHRQTQIRMYN